MRVGSAEQSQKKKKNQSRSFLTLSRKFLCLGCWLFATTSFKKVCIPISLCTYIADSQQLHNKEVSEFNVMSLLPSTQAEHLGPRWWIISSGECRGHHHQSASMAALSAWTISNSCYYLFIYTYIIYIYIYLYVFFFLSVYTLNGERYLTIPRTELR